MYEQMGSGKCSLCGSPGVTKATCPLNPKAKNPTVKSAPTHIATRTWLRKNTIKHSLIEGRTKTISSFIYDFRTGR